ncbi:MAG: hypothetical protein R3C01_00155 [Planctomycetaceae bacterium]
MAPCQAGKPDPRFPTGFENMVVDETLTDNRLPTRLTDTDELATSTTPQKWSAVTTRIASHCRCLL